VLVESKITLPASLRPVESKPGQPLPQGLASRYNLRWLAGTQLNSGQSQGAPDCV